MKDWTLETLKEYLDERAEWQERVRVIEKAALDKALAIKEQADRDALGLARQIQDYKDEKANELRSQIERERGAYVTQPELKAVVDKFETLVGPLIAYVASQQGRSGGISDTGKFALMFLGLLVPFAIYVLTHH